MSDNNKDDLTHLELFYNPDSIIPDQTLTPKMVTQNECNTPDISTPNEEAKADKEAPAEVQLLETEDDHEKNDLSGDTETILEKDQWVMVNSNITEKGEPKKHREQQKLDESCAIIPRNPETAKNSESTAIVAKNTDVSIEPLPLTEGDTFMKEIDNLELDMLEERLMDVYFEEVDDFTKVKFADSCDPDAEMNKYLAADQNHDEDWNALSKEAREILGCPKKEKTKKIYDRYWRQYEVHCKHKKHRDIFSEVSVIDFFIKTKERYGKGTLWSIYSCLNHHFQIKKKVNLKTYSRLKIIMKRITEGHVPRKSPVLSEDEMKFIFENFDDNDPAQLAAKVGIALMYYGLLRCEEVMLVQVKDVVVVDENEIIVKFPYSSKTRDRGFEYYVPQNLVPSFRKYISQLASDKASTTRFLKNWNGRSKKRHQNTGEKGVGRWIALIGTIMEKNVSAYTTHTFRRSAATTLADNGATMTNLKRFGRWTSDTCAEGYIDNSRKMKAERLSLLGAALSTKLEPKKRTQSEAPEENIDQKRHLCEKVGGSASIQTHAQNVVYQNCSLYTGSTMSFGVAAPPPAPQEPPEQTKALFEMIYEEVMGKFKSDSKDSEQIVNADNKDENGNKK